ADPACRPRRLAPVVVFDGPLALLLLGERDVEVEVEVPAERGRPGEAPAHPLLVCLQFRERSPRHRRKRDVVVGQVDDEAVEPVCDRRAGRTPRRVVGPEHEVVNEELRAPSEEVCQRGAPLVGLESIFLVDPDPRQLLPPPRQLVAAPRELLLLLEQLNPGCKPLFMCPGHVLRHRSSPLPSGVLHRAFPSVPLMPRSPIPSRRSSPPSAVPRPSARPRTVGQNPPRTGPGRCPPAPPQCRRGSRTPRRAASSSAARAHGPCPYQRGPRRRRRPRCPAPRGGCARPGSGNGARPSKRCRSGKRGRWTGRPPSRC